MNRIDDVTAVIESVNSGRARHLLQTNLERIGLPVNLIDQTIAEVEDSLWLALIIDAAWKRGAGPEDAR